MNELRNSVMAVLTLSAVVVGWMAYYVAPKDAVLAAAQACMEANPSVDARNKASAQWGVCHSQADSEHGSRLLTWVGY